LMLAKRKKGKPPKGAGNALQAVEAWEAAQAAAGLPEELMMPATPAPIKKKKKKQKQQQKEPADANAPIAVAPPPPAAEAPKVALPAPAAVTMADKMSRIKLELGLDEALPLAKAVAEANAAMGLEGGGSIAAQVELLLEQLGIDLSPITPQPSPSIPQPSTSDSAVKKEPATPDVVTVTPKKAGDIDNLSDEVVGSTTEVQKEEMSDAVQVPEAEEEASEPVITLSKKKQKAAEPDDEDKDVEKVGAQVDTSGRRGMGRRIEKFEGASPEFAYIKLDGGKLRFRNQEVLNGVTWDVQTGQRVGLVGDNGAGKTTQLRVLADELELDEGNLIKSKEDIKVAFLRQEFREELCESRTLKEELMAVFAEVNELEEQYAQCQRTLESVGDDDTEAMQDALDKMEEIQAKLDAADATAIERKVDLVMSSMGFTQADADLLVSSFSGGWKMRIGLGKILLQEPQVLLLDEPTNHMDLDSVEWLEKYLIEQTSKLALVIVTHDREFLDRVCTKIVETEQGIAHSYPGSYRTFLKLKGEREAQQMEAHERQRKQIRELKGEINKLRALESAAAAVRAKERQVKELEPGGALHAPRPFVNKRKFQFRFPPAPRCAPEVIELEGLSHGYGMHSLFSQVNLAIERGDRIAILGPNGAGKSTLLRLILGLEQPTGGRAEIVAKNAVVSFFEQDQANALPLDKSVIETMQDAAAETDFNYEELRALLGKFMFKGEKVDDMLSTLSGGEKARVALCRMLLTPSNLLLLDEPTNHLDIPAKEVLEGAIQNFEGTVVMVSHDRFFISQTANTILALEEGKLVIYDGDYRLYMEKNAKTKQMVEARYVEGVEPIKSAPKIELQPDVMNQNTRRRRILAGVKVQVGTNSKV